MAAAAERRRASRACWSAWPGRSARSGRRIFQGMMQRWFGAGAAQHPAIVFLDEPTSASTAGRREVRDLIMSCAQPRDGLPKFSFFERSRSDVRPVAIVKLDAWCDRTLPNSRVRPRGGDPSCRLSTSWWRAGAVGRVIRIRIVIAILRRQSAIRNPQSAMKMSSPDPDRRERGCPAEIADYLCRRRSRLRPGAAAHSLEELFMR